MDTKTENKHYLSRVMRKPTFCICENKDADQLRGKREADQRLCFRYIDSTIPLLSKSEFQASSHLLRLYSLVCVGPGRKPECWFSHDVAHFSRPSYNMTIHVLLSPANRKPTIRSLKIRVYSGHRRLLIKKPIIGSLHKIMLS